MQRYLTIGTLLLVLYTAGMVRAQEVLFADDFEKGVSAAWLQASKEITVVPEDPAKPDGNKVARFTKNNLRLAGPPVLHGDWKSAEAKREAMKAWGDYELSFRFRVVTPLNLAALKGRAAGFLHLAWHVNPNKDNPSECQLMFLQAWKKLAAPYPWRMNGPLIPWFGRNENFETKDKEVEDVGNVDTAWHTVRVCLQGEQTTLYFDNTLFFQGKDERVLQGGFAITTAWGEIDPGPIDVDDVRVVLPAPPATPGKAEAARVAAAPKIDGKLDDATWKTARPLGGWVTMTKDAKPVTQARTAYVAYDDTNLYVAMRATIEDLELLVSRDDRPELGDTLRVDGANATTGIDCEGKNLNLLMPYLLPVTGKAEITDDGWEAEIAIPWAHFGGKPAPGKPIAFNVSGHDSVDGLVTWARTVDPADTKHFGTLTLLP